MAGFPVRLFVYDLSNGLASQLSLGLTGTKIDGIWHTGIVAFGSEWFWGGILQQCNPGQSGYGTPVKIVELGETHMTREVFEDFISEISHMYTYDSYDLLSNNCNNFTEKASVFLTGNSIPSWISGLPSQVLNTPFGKMIAPMIQGFTTQMKQANMARQGFDSSQFPATQAAITNDMLSSFGNQYLTPSSNPSSASSNISGVSNRSNVQNSISPQSAQGSSPSSSNHTIRKFILTEGSQLPLTDCIKQLKLGTIINDELQAFFASNPKPALSQLAMDSIMSELLNPTQSASSLPLLVVLHSLVLHPQPNKHICSSPKFIDILKKFLTSSNSETIISISLISGSNAFAFETGQRQLLQWPELLDTISPHLSSVTQHLRSTAAAFLYNYVISIEMFPAEIEGEIKWQLATLTIDVLSQALPPGVESSFSPQESQYISRLISSIEIVIATDEAVRSISIELGLLEALKTICLRNPDDNLKETSSKLITLLQ